MKEALVMKLYGVEDKADASQTTKKVVELAKKLHVIGVGGLRKAVPSSTVAENWINLASQDERSWYVDGCYAEYGPDNIDVTNTCESGLS
jgi:hypothetical protein